MSSPTNANYFESKVLTAPPHRLHLMLIEGAIRFGRQAEVPLNRGDAVGASAPLLRAVDIVGELLAGVRDNQSSLTDQVAGVYAFIFRRISEAKINGDATALGEALRLLEFERQTWQLACEKHGNANRAESTQPRAAVALNAPSGDSQGRFSLEA